MALERARQGEAHYVNSDLRMPAKGSRPEQLPGDSGQAAVVNVKDRLRRNVRMDVDGHLKSSRARQNRIESQIVQESVVRQTVDHGAAEAQVTNGTLQLVRSRLARALEDGRIRQSALGVRTRLAPADH